MEQPLTSPALPIHVVTKHASVLVDCAMFQGGKQEAAKNRALHFKLDDLLPLVEAGELLGFLNPEDGALVLTQLGRTYAEASILARKELLAGRVLRMPLINWIYDTLQRDDTQSTARSYFLDKLEGDFGDRAEKQLDIAISWARHARTICLQRQHR